MLADHVVTHFLRLLDIELQGLVARGCVETVRPPSLVKRSVLEQVLAVEGHPFVLVRGLVLLCGDGSHGRVSLDLVDDLFVSCDSDAQTIEIRAVRRPCLHFRYVQDCLAL